jgi:membrane-bound lytic murein transglycosylase D
MPRETQNYVPRLIALRNVLADPAAFGLRLPVIENKPYFVVIDKEQSIDLKLAARFADLSVAEFTELNPSHHRPVISASRTNRIVLPADRAELFQERLQQYIASGKPLVSWKPYTLKANDTLPLIAKRAGVTAQDLIRANSLRRNAQPMPGTVILAPIAAQLDEPHIETTLARFRGTKVIERERSNAVYHRVKRKDTLASVAKRYGVSLSNLRALNKLKDDTLTAGMRLLIRPAQTRTVMTDERGVKRVVN